MSVAAPFASAQAADESVETKIKFLGKELIQKENKATAEQFIAEYIPNGENFDNFTVMFAVYFYKGHTKSAELEAKAKIAEIKVRKANGDKVANGRVGVKDAGQAVADFVLSSGLIIEHNVMMFKSLKNGLLIHKFVRRVYRGKGASASPKVKKFFSKIKRDRAAITKELERKDLPVPGIAK